MAITAKLKGELFEIATRGALAAEFIRSDVIPDNDQMAALRGERGITVRDIGEIGAAIGCHIALHIQEFSEARQEGEQ